LKGSVRPKNNGNERSDFFEAEDIERMLEKGKGAISSSHKKQREASDYPTSGSPSKASIKPDQTGIRFRTDSKPHEKRNSEFELRSSATSDF